MRRLLRSCCALVAVLVLGLAGCSDDSEVVADSSQPPLTGDVSTKAPTSPPPSIDPTLQRTVTPLTDGLFEVRAEPDTLSELTHTLDHPRLIDGDPDAAVPLVLLVIDDRDGWYQVQLPVRPNGTTGWVRADAVAIATHPYRIEVALGEYELRVFERDEVIFTAPIAVATDNTPTPGGRFFTTELVAPYEPEGAYGPYAYGLSGFSEVFETFNGGPGQLAIHGTNQPELLGSQVSAGCIRMHNDDITHLAEVIGLPLGVPVDILASPAV